MRLRYYNIFQSIFLKAGILCTAFIIFNFNVFAQEISWASKVISFSSHKSDKVFSAEQILSKPNCYPNVGFSPCAWMPSVNDNLPGEYIKVGFDKPAHTKQILIVENYYPGNIQKIFVFDSLDKKYLVYDNPLSASTISEGKLFTRKIDNIKFRIFAVQLEFSKSNADNLYQIDAIGISSSETPINLTVNTINISDTATIERLPAYINSNIDELYPVISPDGNTLFFDRKGHPENAGAYKYDDIWYSIITDKKYFGVSKNIGSPLNNINPNFICSISPDGNKILLGNIFNDDGSISPGVSLTYKSDSGWMKPVAQNIEGFYNTAAYNEYCLSNDGNILLMTIAMDDALGQRDIYVSFNRGNNKWSKPQNLGKQINTAAEELSPFIASDNETIYFSTDGRAGYGLQDIYMSKRLDKTWTTWIEPVNLGNKINSASWEAYYTVDAKGLFAYFCSNKDAINNLDIYRMKLPEQIQPDSMVSVSGKITDRSTGKLIAAQISYYSTSNIEGGTSNTTNSSDYLFYVKPGDTIGFTIENEKYYQLTGKIGAIDKDVVYDFELIPKQEGTIIEMRNILFNADSWILKDSSYNELNKIKQFLSDNPGISIEIRGHTNGLCEDDYCLMLSERRAKMVSDYFIKNGIENTRLTYKGYGKTIPVAENDTPDGRKKNQRVEFMITKAD
ncbi:MAG: OmpA family protein [Fimbriimonadaceae bacterium]|nr:OmpA family protein [Chitinophagales bacterium]